MQIDFYYWGGMCPISAEIRSALSRYGDKFLIRFHDITNAPDLAKRKHIFFPFLTVVNGEKRYYGPVSGPLLQSLSAGILPEETPYKIAMGTDVKCGRLQPITARNYSIASRCTGRGFCSGCGEKMQMYQAMPDGIMGFMNTNGETLLGGAEYYPSLRVPYDIPKGPEIAFITCVYLSDKAYDCKSAPLRALEQYLSGTYKKAVVISGEEGTFPNGDAKFFEKNGYHDEKLIFEDSYCRLHLFSKDLR